MATSTLQAAVKTIAGHIKKDVHSNTDAVVLMSMAF